MRAIGVVLAITGLVATSESVAAPLQAPATLQFEVASVRENTSGERRVSRRFLPGGRVEITNMPLKMLIGFAYGIDTSTEEFRLSGGDDRILARRFDIAAVAPTSPPPTPEDLMAMLRGLLAERFALKVHTEPRPMSVYALTVAEEGKLGPRLRPSKQSCSDWGLGPPETEPRDENGRALCGVNQMEVLPGGYLRRHAGTIARLGQMAQRAVAELRDRLVVDMTGLTGNYQWEYTYAANNRLAPPTDAPSLPSIFTAFREQLGLRLEPKTVPVDVLVTDSVSMPSPN